MPERALSLIEQIAILLAIGIVAAVGQALVSSSIPPWRQTLGRALTNSILSMGAGAILSVIPHIPVLGLIGIAALLATYGKAGFERVARKYLERKGYIDKEGDE